MKNEFDFLGIKDLTIAVGVVEDRHDPLQLRTRKSEMVWLSYRRQG